MFDPATFADGAPQAFFDRIRREEPAYRNDDPDFGTIWSLTRYADIRMVSADNARFHENAGIMYPFVVKSGPSFDNQMALQHGPRHTRLRRMIQGALPSPGGRAQFDRWIRDVCVEIVGRVREAGTFDAIPMIAAALPAQVIASLRGIPDEARGNLLGWAARIFSRQDPEVGFAGFVEAREQVYEYSHVLRNPQAADEADGRRLSGRGRNQPARGKRERPADRGVPGRLARIFRGSLQRLPQPVIRRRRAGGSPLRSRAAEPEPGRPSRRTRWLRSRRWHSSCRTGSSRRARCWRACRMPC